MKKEAITILSQFVTYSSLDRTEYAVEVLQERGLNQPTCLLSALSIDDADIRVLALDALAELEPDEATLPAVNVTNKRTHSRTARWWINGDRWHHSLDPSHENPVDLLFQLRCGNVLDHIIGSSPPVSNLASVFVVTGNPQNGECRIFGNRFIVEQVHQLIKKLNGLVA
ncbi:hypothetical protein Poly41_39950 [Novipirellula artificiosorum]|uniref:Uncharacterized protein n=1 Tax=Novipirellula artificiosorum TaxID=2528016 RepID=A0A5C6DDN0_9BACT|nr:hypothetical protein Poly41_39950 [Novipirellula artificiosorum]